MTPKWSSPSAVGVLAITGLLVVHPMVLTPIPLVATFGALCVGFVATALTVRWWSLMTAALACYVIAYAVALALGPERLDLLAPVVAAGWVLVFELTDLVTSLRAGTTIHRRALMARVRDALAALTLALGGGMLVLAADASIGVQSPATIVVATLAALAALGYVIQQSRRATS